MALTPLARRTAASIFGAGGVLLGLAAPAVADIVPGCSAADITAVESQVAAGVAGYLFTHPDVNLYFSSVQGQPQAAAISKIASYLAANPQTQADLDAIRGPASDLRDRCNISDASIHLGVL
jgi:hemophore-related protein